MFTQYVGQRIKYFRLEAGLSLGKLAEAAGKSRKTIYNYETGQTPVDVATLARIARALRVTFYQLTDLEFQPSPAARLHPFGQFDAMDRLFMYHLEDGAAQLSVIRAVDATQAGISAVLYYKVERPQQPDGCSCIYIGQAHSEYSTLSFTMRNHFNRAEHILINLSIRHPGNAHTVGLISRLDVRTLEPMAFKVLVAIRQMDENEVHRRLSILPEEYRRFRSASVLYALEG